MKEIRYSQESNQDNAERAYLLINKMMNEHSEIEQKLWCVALFSTLATGYKQGGLSYNDFCEELNNACLHYKKWWDKSDTP